MKTNYDIPVPALPTILESARQIVRREKVMQMAGFTSKSTLYRWISQGLFVPPVKLGPRNVGWYLHEVQGWIDSREVAR